jgi:hypothetical protein
MRLWMIWAVLAAIWGLQATAAAVIHNVKYALVMYGMALLFAAVGFVVRQHKSQVN